MPVHLRDLKPPTARGSCLQGSNLQAAKAQDSVRQVRCEDSLGIGKYDKIKHQLAITHCYPLLSIAWIAWIACGLFPHPSNLNDLCMLKCYCYPLALHSTAKVAVSESISRNLSKLFKRLQCSYLNQVFRAPTHPFLGRSYKMRESKQTSCKERHRGKSAPSQWPSACAYFQGYRATLGS